MDNPSADLLMRWRGGDQQAAGDLFRRYVEGLVALARSRLSGRLARHVDPEDVVQSAPGYGLSGVWRRVQRGIVVHALRPACGAALCAAGAL